MLFLNILEATIAKQTTASAATLPDNQKQSIAQDQTFEVQSWAIVGSHVRVALKQDSFQGRNTWFFFGKHIQIRRDDSLLYPARISSGQATSIFEKKVEPRLLADLNQCLTLFEINSPARMRHFVAQIAHESGGLQWLQELGDGWDYEGRTDLGNTEPGDGPRYKGAGVIQLTGRANYQALSTFMHDPRIMDGVEYVAKTYPVCSAGFWWQQNHMNALVDSGADVYAITKRVNGGLNGIDDRLACYERACQALPA